MTSPITGPLLNTVEAKVKTGAATAAIVGLLMTLLNAYVFKGNTPVWVEGVLGTLVTGGLTFAVGYLTRHTTRPADLNPEPPVAP